MSNSYYYISTMSSSRNKSEFEKKNYKFNRPFGKKCNRMSVKYGFKGQKWHQTANLYAWAYSAAFLLSRQSRTGIKVNSDELHS